MSNHHNPNESAGTSNVGTDIEQQVIITVSNENLNPVKPQSNKKTNPNTSKNAPETNQPNSSENKEAENVKADKHNSVRSQIVNNALDVILQQTLHQPKNVALNADPEAPSQQTERNELKHAKNFHRLNRSVRDPGLEQSMSSNSSSEESVTLTSTTVRLESVEACQSPPQANRRLEGVASDTNIIEVQQRPSLRDLIQTRSEVRIEDEVDAELLRIREEYLRTQVPIVGTRLQIESNHIVLDTVPEAPQSNYGTCRGTHRGNRILRYYRSLRGSVDEDHDTNTTIGQQTSTQYYSTPPLTEAPPTYSAVIRSDEMDDTLVFVNRNGVGVQQSPPFIAPRPPPTYAEAEGFSIERPMFLTSIEQLVWGPEPTYIVCPRCAHLILTSTHTRISSVNHVSAIILCLCGCWPCCFIPYCVDSCKNTYHYCPNCSLFLGVYRPW